MKATVEALRVAMGKAVVAVEVAAVMVVARSGSEVGVVGARAQVPLPMRSPH